MILTTSEESRLLDQRAMTEYGLPEAVLMENAGASVVQLMKEKISWEDARVVIVCGSGNNGGDGFVTARYALSEGADVTVLVMGDASHMGENSLLYKNIAAKMGIPVISVAGADDAGWGETGVNAVGRPGFSRCMLSLPSSTTRVVIVK